MRVINVSLSELETKVLLIGFEGENQITQVRIDAAEILTDHPNATPTLIAKPLFGFAYPVIVEKEGTDVVWEIDNSVLSFHGDGEIQLTFTEGTVIAKSYVGRIRIKRSLAVNGEAPDPIETWEQAATAKLAEVDAQIGELEDMVEAAEAAKDEAQDIVDDAAADIQAAGAAQVQVVQAKGTEVLNSIPSDYSTLSGDVNGLKGAIQYGIEWLSESSIWESGAFDATTGADVSNNARLRTPAYYTLNSGYAEIRTNSGYLFAVHAWQNNTYIGSLKTNGTFSTGATNLAWVNNYQFNKNPDYSYRFVLRKDPSVLITPEDGTNAFILYAYLDRDRINALTNEFVQEENRLALEWVSGYYLSGTSGTYNENASFKYSKPVYIGVKTKIAIKAKGYGTVVNIVSRTSSLNGGYYFETLRSTDSLYKWYFVEIKEPGYYTFCSNASDNYPVIVSVISTEESQYNNILSVFPKIICCGDSLTYGLVYTAATTYRQAKAPYNEALQKITGVTSIRYATAGYTTKNWWDANNQHLNEDGLYIIFLGTNGGLTDTIDTDCPGNDVSDFADTNTGCYGKILRTLQINNKTAVLIKPPTANDTTQSVIEKFGRKYSFPTISLPPELANDYYHYAPHNINYKNTVHYNDMGYVAIANFINHAINNYPPVRLFEIAPY